MKSNLIIEAPSVIDLNRNKKFANCFIVDDKQPKSIAKAVEQLAYYFKREGRFDFVQYVAYEDRDSARVNAYIWIDTDWDDTFAVGAAGFRFLGDVGQVNNWSLQWVWFHPYYRCKGLLSGAWEAFVNRYGKDFHIELPLSYEMECFLKKMNHSLEYKDE